MEVLRTPDSRFDDLVEYPFAPHYVNIPSPGGGTLRVHYVDEGSPEDPTILLLHGNPTWSYSYRRVIPALTLAGFRVVAPDLVGLGRSDKPAAASDYSFPRHLEWLRATIEEIDLHRATLVGQDWGGIMSLCLLDKIGTRFDRVVASNTGFYRSDIAPAASEATKSWYGYSQKAEVFSIGKTIASQSHRGLTTDEIAGYDAPFPTEPFKVGARTFASFIPSLPHAEATRSVIARGWQNVGEWKKPFLVAFSDQDFMTAKFAAPLRRECPGAEEQPEVTIENAKHYVQDDAPQALATEILKFIDRTT